MLLKIKQSSTANCLLTQQNRASEKKNCAHNQKEKSLEASRQPKCRRNEARNASLVTAFFPRSKDNELSRI